MNQGHKVLTFEEVVTAEKMWHDRSGLWGQFDDLNAFLNHITSQVEGGEFYASVAENPSPAAEDDPGGM